MVGATGREAGMVHQRHGCEHAGRLHGTVTALEQPSARPLRPPESLKA